MGYVIAAFFALFVVIGIGTESHEHQLKQKNQNLKKEIIKLKHPKPTKQKEYQLNGVTVRNLGKKDAK